MSKRIFGSVVLASGLLLLLLLASLAFFSPNTQAGVTLSGTAGWQGAAPEMVEAPAPAAEQSSAASEPVALPTGTWQDVAPFPTVQGDFTPVANPMRLKRAGAAAYTDGNIYVLGGRHGTDGEDQWLRWIWKYTPNAPGPGTWTRMNALLDQSAVGSRWTANMAVATLTNTNGVRIYAVGGSRESSEPTPAVRVYDPIADTLTNDDPWPATPARVPGGYAVVNNKLYIFGGFSALGAGSVFTDTWVFDPMAAAGSRWSQIPSANLNLGRGYIAGVAMDGKIYAVGGDTWQPGSPGALVPVNNVEMMNPALPSPTWTVVASLPTARGDLGAWAYDTGTPYEFSGRILAAGGVYPTADAKTYVYDPLTNSWHDDWAPDLTHATRNFARAQLNGWLYAFGGYETNVQGANFNQRYDATTPLGSPTPTFTGTPPTATNTPVSTGTFTRTSTPTLVPGTCFFEGFESNTLGQFTPTGTPGWTPVPTPHTGIYAAFAPDPGTVTDQQLTLINPVGIAGTGRVLSFWHGHGFEGSVGSCYDGGVLEVSTDNGTTWGDVGPTNFLQGGYNGTIVGTFSNPLSGRQAWCGSDTTYHEVRVNLNAFAGNNLKFRFRLGSDSSVAGTGWWIDDISISPCGATPTGTPPTVTATPTVTNTPVGGTNTPTRTNTRTVTNTRTSTRTQTSTPTVITNTPTSTNTPGGSAGQWIDIAPYPTVQGDFTPVAVPMRLKRAGAAAYTDGNIYVLGGRHGTDGEDQHLRYIWKYTPGNPGSWSRMNALLDQSAVGSRWTANMAVAVLTNTIGARIFAVGGTRENSEPTPGVRVYDPVADSLTEDDPWPASPARAPGGYAVYNNKLYIFGGFSAVGTGSVFTDTWEFDPMAAGGQRWRQLPSANLNLGRGYIAGATLDGKIYAIGGDVWQPGSPGALVPVSNVEMMDPSQANPTWTAVASLPTARGDMGAWAYNTGTGYEISGKIVAAGGIYPTPEAKSYLYNPTTNTWNDSAISDLLHPTRNFAKAQLNGRLYAFGGYETYVQGANFNQMYDANLQSTPTGTPPTVTLTPTRTATSQGPTVTRTNTSQPGTNTNTPAPGTNTNTPIPGSRTNTPITTNTPGQTVGPTDTPTGTPCSISFTDVHPDEYFYEPVQYLYCAGVLAGYDDNTFRPYNYTTRGQMVKIVVNGFGIPLSDNQDPIFADVATTHPFFVFVQTAAENQVVSGYACGGPGEPCDGQNRPYFRPYNLVTRGQLSKITVVAAGWQVVSPSAPTFNDVPPDSDFYEYIETAACT